MDLHLKEGFATFFRMMPTQEDLPRGMMTMCPGFSLRAEE